VSKKSWSVKMNRHFLMTIVLVGAFVLPANAYAKKQQDGSYKPKNAIEKAEKKKRKNKKNKAGKKNKTNKAVAKKNKPKKAKKKPKVANKGYRPPAPQVHHRKKKKNAKIKKFFKKTLKLLAEDAYRPNHYAKPRRQYGYDDRPRGYRNNNKNYGYSNNHCIPKHRVFRRLKKNGWRRIEMINQGPNRASLFASNRYNERYKLVVHKCSGRLIKRIPLDY